MNTYTPRHTARPSRSRVMSARVGAWFDRHDDAITLAVVAVVVVLVMTLTALTLIGNGVRVTDSLGAVSVSLACSLFAAFFAYMVGSERATRRVSRRYSRYMSEQNDKHERDMARAIGTRSVNEMSAYEMSAELARIATRDTHLRNALRVKVRA